MIFLGQLLLAQASGQDDQTIQLYLETGHTVSSAFFSQNGKTIISFGDSTLKLWEVKSGQEMDTINGIDQFAVSRDQRSVALAFWKEKAIIVWDVAAWRQRQRLSWDGGIGGIGNLFFLGNGRMLGLSNKTTLTIWDITTGSEIHSTKFDPRLGSSTFFSLDGNVIAWIASDKIVLFDAAHGQELHRLSVSSDYNTVIFSPDGKTIASANSTTLKLWEVASGNELHTLTVDLSYGFITFSPDGNTIAVTNSLGLRLWNVTSGEAITGLAGPGIINLIFSPDGKTIVFGFGVLNDAGLALWNVGSNQQPRILKQHVGFLSTVFSPDGKIIAIGSMYFNTGPSQIIMSATLWDVASGKELPGSKQPISLVQSTNGEGAVSWVEGGNIIKLLEPISWRELKDLRTDSSIGAVTFSPDAKMIVSRYNNAKATVWDASSGQQISSLEGNIYGFSTLIFSPDTRTMGSVMGNIDLWDVSSGRQLRTLKGNAFAVKFFALSRDGILATWVSQDKVVKLWDLASGGPPRTLLLNEAIASQHHASPHPFMRFDAPMAADFSPDGRIIAVWSTTENIAVLWDLASGKRLHTLEVKEGPLSALVFSPDGKTIALGKADGIGFWDVATGVLRRTFKGAAGSGIVFSPDEKLLASWNADYTIRVWNLASGWELHPSEGHSQAISAIIFSPDSKTIASASADHTIMLWDAVSGQRLQTFVGHEKSVGSVAFSGDGKTIASGSDDGTTRLWDVSSGKVLRIFQSDDPKTAGEIHRVVPDYFGKNKSAPISADGKFQVKLGENGRINLFDVNAGLPLVSFIALADEEWAVTTPAGRFDTNKSLDRIAGLHWIVNGELLNPLPLDVFMRQYYEPGLLRRALRGEQFKPLPSIADINRVQPKVSITNVNQAANDADSVEVTVDVESATEAVSISATDPAKKKRFSSGAFDLRLFRDGQLVGYSTSDEKLQTTFRTYANFADESAVWREANKIDLLEGKKTFTFAVELPAVPSGDSPNREVEFSAYAFNEDRVKSNTATLRWSLDDAAKSQSVQSRAKPRAYVIAVGANANENPAFDLQFAANDARRFQEVLLARLAATNEYSEVVPVSLISDWEERGGQKVTTQRGATKANFKAVIDLLAGRRVSDDIKRAIPNAGKLLRSTPDDLVMILFSSHGYADRNGAFYFIPYDTGSGTCKSFTETVRTRSISSDELSLWLRDVDAGQMTLIVDACYSSAAIEGSGFKPGPMGSRGLGQLAYDKRMRILTATQADNVAMELTATADGRAIKHGLLSYALLENGLDAGSADFKPLDNNIFMAEWLEFGAVEVPKLFALMPKPPGGVSPTELQAVAIGPSKNARLVMQRELADTGRCGPVNRSQQSRPQEQQPALFDFTRRGRDVLLMRKN
jgi:WD40 repeat protein